MTINAPKKAPTGEITDFNEAQEEGNEEDDDAGGNDWFNVESDDDKSDDDDDDDFGEDDDDDIDDRFEFVSEEDRRAFKAFYDDLTPDQQRRYESFRRSRFNRRYVKKLVSDVLNKKENALIRRGNMMMGSGGIYGSSNNNNNKRKFKKNEKVDEASLVIIGGLAKMFAGDIVEHARIIMENKKEKGAICPRHLREAYRHLKRLGAVPGQGRFKKLRR